MREYHVQGRNGYWAIDEYQDGKCLRLVEIFKTRKLAESVAGALAQAASDGYTAGVAVGRTMGPVTDGERLARIRGMD